jgi:hypothetical protein
VIYMALRDNVSGREYDKFVNTSEGTALRVSTVAGGSVSSNLVTATGSADITTTETVLIQKQTLNGRTGSWFVYNTDSTGGGESMDVKMYSAYVSGASNWAAPASGATQWDVVGSTITVAAGDTKHIPFNNVYRYVALTASTSANATSGATAELYAL